MKRFGLIGYPVSHSYSQDFFQKKFKKLGLKDRAYDLFEMEFLHEFRSLWLKYDDLQGVNITVPHKETVRKYLDKEDASVIKVGAANIIHKKNGELIGYNTDYMAFKESLNRWMGDYNGEALVLGTGGAAKAVQAGMADLGIPHHQVSRNSKTGDYTYDQLKNYPEIIPRFQLIVNTTPLGMYPDVESFPEIPYTLIKKGSFMYDLIYNPEETQFLKKGKLQEVKTKNGLEMLQLQAEKSWDIWTGN